MLLVTSGLVRKVHAPQTHQPVLQISRNTRMCRLSVGRIIRDLFRATHPAESNLPIQLQMYPRLLEQHD